MNEVSRTWEVRYVDSYGQVMHTTVYHDPKAARELLVPKSKAGGLTATGWTIHHGRNGDSEEAGLR